jgi:hypothetical protein
MQSQEAIKAALGDEYAKFALNFASYLIIGPKRVDLKANAQINNACITLVQLNGRKVGITNDHVVEHFFQRQEKGEDVICQVGNQPVDLNKCMISRSARYDLATIDLEAIDQTRIRGPDSKIPLQFQVPATWPAEMPKTGEFILFGGFPSSKRRDAGHGHLNFGSVSSGGTEVVSVQEDVITCQLKIKECHVHFDDDGTGLTGLPGISGSPVMKIRQTNAGIAVVDLIGIIFEHTNAYDALRIRPTSLIEVDGQIRE